MSKHLHFYEIVAGADDGRAMESGDHSRLLSVAEINGASPKSQTGRGNSLMSETGADVKFF